MQPRDPSRRQHEVLSSRVAERILARAAELDAAQKAAIDVDNLRAAAVEAGISASAFDSALEEMQGGEQLPASPSPRRRSRVRAVLLGAAVLVFAGTYTFARRAVPVPIPMTEQAFFLRCLPPGEAAELIRPLLERRSTMAYAPARAPRVLTLRSTPEELAKVGAILDERDGAACAAPATTR